MKPSILLLFLALALTGCGPVASDTTTMTYTTTTTAAAELSQDNTKALCVGLFNIGSCNTVAVQTQNVNRPAGAPAPNSGMSGGGMVGTLVLLCLAFVFVMLGAAVVMGSGGYN